MSHNEFTEAAGRVQARAHALLEAAEGVLSEALVAERVEYGHKFINEASAAVVSLFNALVPSKDMPDTTEPMSFSDKFDYVLNNSPRVDEDTKNFYNMRIEGNRQGALAVWQEWIEDEYQRVVDERYRK